MVGCRWPNVRRQRKRENEMTKPEQGATPRRFTPPLITINAPRPDVGRFLLVTDGDWPVALTYDLESAEQIREAVNAHATATELATMVDDWFAGRTFNGQEERAAIAAKAREFIALTETEAEAPLVSRELVDGLDRIESAVDRVLEAK